MRTRKRKRIQRAAIRVLAALLALSWATIGGGACGDAKDAGSGAIETDEQGMDYATALRKGRAEVEAREFTAAVTSFQAALADRPGDVRALSELAWAALQAGRLDQAERAARELVAAQAPDDLRAAAFDHLGRIAEKRNDRVAAIRSYRRSLALRPDQFVRQRLAAIDPVRSRPLDGPHSSLQAFCAAFVQTGGRGKAGTCGPVEAVGVEVVAPITAMAAVALSADERGHNRGLALQTESGWFVAPGFATDERPHQEFAVERVHEHHGRLLIEHAERTHERDQGDNGPSAFAQVLEARYTTICDIGDSGQLSCLGPILTAFTPAPGDRDGAVVPSDPIARSLGPSFHVDLTSGSQVTIRQNQANGAEPGLIDIWVGEHALRFP